MPPSATDGVLHELASRLLTLRVTVVLSRNLEGQVSHLDEATIRTRLYDSWRAYLARVPEPQPPSDVSFDVRVLELASPPSEPRLDRPPTSQDFAELATRARSVKQRLERKAAPPSDEMVSFEPTSGRGDLATTELDAGVVERIAKLCDELETPKDDDVGRVSRQLLLGRAVALGTDPVLLETFITVSGDVTTRIDEAWLERGDDPSGHRIQTVLELQRMGVHTAITWWSELVELLGKAGSKLLDLVLRR